MENQEKLSKKDFQERIGNFIPKSTKWHLYNLAKTQEKRFFYKLL
ncbi:MAG: hypothetical protein AABX11_01555 [Nanoarchaeota archaeon]